MAKKPTFHAAQQNLINHMLTSGWRANQGSVVGSSAGNYPPFTSPDNGLRVFLHPRSVYFSLGYKGVWGKPVLFEADIRDHAPTAYLTRLERLVKLNRDALFGLEVAVGGRNPGRG